MIDEEHSLSWIGFTDLFLHLFIFFLASFMLLKYFAAIELERARAAEETNQYLMAQFESCGQQKAQIETLGQTCQNQLEQNEKTAGSNLKNLMLCRQQKTRLEDKLGQLGDNLQQCQIAIEQVDETKKREDLRVAFGKIITQALSVLEKLKTKMESNLPIHIDRRPDRLFFDMGVSFPFNQTQIPAQQKRVLIDIAKTFRDILDSRVYNKKKNGPDK